MAGVVVDFSGGRTFENPVANPELRVRPPWRAVLRGGVPVAGVVVEFSGGRGSWVQRTYSAARGGGAHLDGARIGVGACASLQRALLVRAHPGNTDKDQGPACSTTCW